MDIRDALECGARFCLVKDSFAYNSDTKTSTVVLRPFVETEWNRDVEVVVPFESLPCTDLDLGSDLEDLNVELEFNQARFLAKCYSIEVVCVDGENQFSLGYQIIKRDQ